MNTTSTDKQYRNALEVVLKTNRASTSHFQRKLGLGYRAARELIDLLEKKGVVGHQSDAGSRQIIAERLQSELADTKRMALMERLQNCAEELQAISREIARELAPVNQPQLVENEFGKIGAIVKQAKLAAAIQRTEIGPVFAKALIALDPGVRYAEFVKLEKKLKDALGKVYVRFEVPVAGTDLVGIEFAHSSPQRVVCDAATYKTDNRLPIPIGCGTSSHLIVGDLTEMSHLLVGGGNGLEVNALLRMLVDGFVNHYAKDEIQFILIDSSWHAFEQYAEDRHLIVPVATDLKRIATALRWAVCEMERRFRIFARACCRTIEEYNHRLPKKDDSVDGSNGNKEDLPATVPYIVIVVDEISDIAEHKEVVSDISRLTAKARSAGIHLVLATGKPSGKVLTGTFKANIPSVIAFKTNDAKESKSILDAPGAEALRGTGDCLYRGKNGCLLHLQTPVYQQV